jgi:hypothetical protein
MRTFDGFFDILSNLDWLAIIVATLVVAVGLGFIFYGPVFGRRLAAATGEPFSMKVDLKRDITGLLMAFVFQIGVAYLGAYDDLEHALVTAVVVGILLIAPVLYGSVLYGGGTRIAFLIDAGYYFFGIAVGTFVQGLFA